MFEERRRRNVAISMDSKGCWWDNLFVEHFWKTLKYEETYSDCIKLTSGPVLSRHSPQSYLHVKIGIVPISFRNDSHFKRQANIEERVVPPEPSRAFLRIELGHLVEDFGVVLQCNETVCELFRNIEYFPGFRRKRHRYVFPEGGRIRAEVYNHVAYCTHGTPHQFRFLMGRLLVVHTAEGTFFEIERDTALDQARVQPVLFEFLLTPRAGKKAATIPSLFGIDDVGTA